MTSHSLRTRVDGKSAKRAFEIGVEKFLADWSFHDEVSGKQIRRLATDNRLTKVWARCNGDERVILTLLGCVNTASIMARSAEEYLRTVTSIEAGTRDIERGIEAIALFCSAEGIGLKREERQHVESVSRMIGPLRRFAKIARDAADRDRRAFELFLPPNSREKNPDRAMRVQFVCSVVSEIKSLLGRPHFAEIAEILNVVFDLDDEEQVDAGYIRDAWRDHGVARWERRPGRRRQKKIWTLG